LSAAAHVAAVLGRSLESMSHASEITFAKYPLVNYEDQWVGEVLSVAELTG
jgi:hypothetical protein